MKVGLFTPKTMDTSKKLRNISGSSKKNGQQLNAFHLCPNLETQVTTKWLALVRLLVQMRLMRMFLIQIWKCLASSTSSGLTCFSILFLTYLLIIIVSWILPLPQLQSLGWWKVGRRWCTPTASMVPKWVWAILWCWAQLRCLIQFFTTYTLPSWTGHQNPSWPAGWGFFSATQLSWSGDPLLTRSLPRRIASEETLRMWPTMLSSPCVSLHTTSTA